MKPRDYYDLTPCEILRHAEAHGAVEAERFKQQLSLFYLNAKLGRAEKIPPIDKFLPKLGGTRGPSLSQISAAFRKAPTHTPTG